MSATTSPTITEQTEAEALTAHLTGSGITAAPGTCVELLRALHEWAHASR